MAKQPDHLTGAPLTQTPSLLPGAVAPNPHTSPGDYLIGKGWRVLGDPSWQSSLWLDPQQPLVAYYTEEPCMYEVEVREEYADEATGQIKARFKREMRQVLAQDGRGGAHVAARRQVYHPKGEPMNITGALVIQLERDARETLREEELRVKAATENARQQRQRQAS